MSPASIISQAQDYLNRAAQTDEQRAKVEYGKRQVAERMTDKFLDKDVPELDTEKDGNIIDKARNEIYKATMSEEQKKWDRDAEKSIPEKARDEAKEKIGSAFPFVQQSEKISQKEAASVDHHNQGPIGNMKDVVGSAGDEAKEKTESAFSSIHESEKTSPKEAASVDHHNQGPIGNMKDVVGSTVQGTVDGIGNAANATKETAGSVANGAKDIAQGTVDGIGNAANATKETAGSVVNGAKDIAQDAANAIGRTFGGTKDETKEHEPAEQQPREISEASLQDGAIRLGDTVAKEANNVVKDIKSKFEERLNENSAGEKIQAESSDSKKN